MDLVFTRPRIFTHASFDDQKQFAPQLVYGSWGDAFVLGYEINHGLVWIEELPESDGFHIFLFRGWSPIGHYSKMFQRFESTSMFAALVQARRIGLSAQYMPTAEELETVCIEVFGMRSYVAPATIVAPLQLDASLRAALKENKDV